MPSDHPRRALRRAASTSLVLASFALACSSGGGGDCTTCPVPTDAALQVQVEFDALSRGLTPSGFRIQDLSRIEVSVEGGAQGTKTVQLTPPQGAAFFDVFAGSYTVRATGILGTDLVLFRSAPQTVAVATGDTASVSLPMLAELGEVTFEIDGARTGAVDAVAGEDVPFVVTVQNTQGRPVPGAAVVISASIDGFGSIAFEGTNATDADGRVRGSIRAPRRGVMGGFAVQVDGRPITVPATLRVEFATAVDAASSEILQLDKPFITGDGIDQAEFIVRVRNARGDPLEGVPVSATSSRNAGVDPGVDLIAPLPGYESGKTDAFGLFAFAVRSRTSSFMELDSQGRLFSPSDAGRVFIPATIRVFADGVGIDQRDLTFNSVVNPATGTLDVSPQFPAVGSSVLIVLSVRELAQFGGGPAVGVFVELTNALNQSLNYQYDFRPEPGFNGFRTNSQGVWRGRLHSSVPLDLFMEAKADGRALMLGSRSVFFR